MAHALPETAGKAAAPASRCRKCRRARSIADLPYRSKDVENAGHKTRPRQYPMLLYWNNAIFASIYSNLAIGLLETKKHPAVKAASEVREHGSKRRDAERQLRMMRYRADYYEKLFPWIMEYVGDDVPDEAVDLSRSHAVLTDDPEQDKEPSYMPRLIQAQTQDRKS